MNDERYQQILNLMPLFEEKLSNIMEVARDSDDPDLIKYRMVREKVEHYMLLFKSTFSDEAIDLEEKKAICNKCMKEIFDNLECLCDFSKRNYKEMETYEQDEMIVEVQKYLAENGIERTREEIRKKYENGSW